MRKITYLESMANLRKKVDDKIQEKFKEKPKKNCAICGKVIRKKWARRYCPKCRLNGKKRKEHEYRNEDKEVTPQNVKRSCNAKRDIMKEYGYDNLAEDIRQEHTILWNQLKRKDKSRTLKQEQEDRVQKLKQTIRKLEIK